MSIFTLITFLISLAAYGAAAAVPRAPATPQSRAGPSGQVIAPAGGAVFSNLGSMGQIHVQYQRVEQTYLGAEASTIGIDLVLHYPDGSQPDMPVAYGLRASPPTASVIDAYFVPPGGACGDIQLVVTEYQYIAAQAYVVSFQSAAPTINIECGPIQ